MRSVSEDFDDGAAVSGYVKSTVSWEAEERGSDGLGGTALSRFVRGRTPETDEAPSSVEVTKALIRRIERPDGALKSYSTCTFGLALSQANEADSEISRGKVRGPLHGVPVAVKELCNTKGIPTAAGMAIHKAYLCS